MKPPPPTKSPPPPGTPPPAHNPPGCCNPNKTPFGFASTQCCDPHTLHVVEGETCMSSWWCRKSDRSKCNTALTSIGKGDVCEVGSTQASILLNLPLNLSSYRPESITPWTRTELRINVHLTTGDPRAEPAAGTDLSAAEPASAAYGDSSWVL